MAISGVVDADIVTIANALGESRQRIAFLLGYTYLAKAASAADHGGGSHQADMTLTNMHGDVRVQWGDGTADYHATGAASLTPTHVYAGAGTYVIQVTSLAFQKWITRTIA